MAVSIKNFYKYKEKSVVWINMPSSLHELIFQAETVNPYCEFSVLA